MEIDSRIAEKQRELFAAQTAQRAAERDAFPPNALLWVALGPGWTASIASNAGFPSGNTSAGLVLEQTAELGLTSRFSPAPALQVDDKTGDVKILKLEEIYSSGEQAIREIIEHTTEPSQREEKLKQCIRNIAAGLRSAQARYAVLPDPILKWLELAERIDSYPSAKDYLLEQVDNALAKKDEPAAVAWVESAFPLERALEGQISLAVRLAGLSVQLHQRRAANERYLRIFLERHDQIKAFNNLCTGPDSLWALHYAGSAGVGKTMLLRYLESRAAPQAGASTARVDFDYLNPEYPTTKPALLLIQFAEELRLADKTGMATSYLQSFYDKAQTLHERIGGQARTVAVPRADDPEFQSLLEMFASAIKELPGRVVLILDTCEELAKMKPDGSPQAGVQMTFSILERLHQQIPSLRVVFCGRRPLASSGDGWTTLKSTDSTLVQRLYLRLHEIRTFSKGEAHQYLRQLAKCPEGLIEPILTHCREKGYTRLFSSSGTRSSDRTDVRYSPFELALYAAWATEQPPPSPELVAETTLDQYVRTRIVGRIENRELAALLPAITWLGLFDEKALASLADLPEGCDRLKELFDELQALEWVETGTGAGFLVQPGMRKRLLDYYAEHDSSAYDSGRTAAADYLEKLLPALHVREMSVVHLEAAIEALQPEPARAAAWWQTLERCVLQENAWDWILAPTLRLLAEEHWPASCLRHSHIRSAVAATRAAAQVHTGDLTGAQEISRLMQTDAPSHPDPQRGRQLVLIAQALRAELGDYDESESTEELGAAIITGMEWTFQNPKNEFPKALQNATSALLRWLRALDLGGMEGVSGEQQAFAFMLLGCVFASTVEDRSIPRFYFESALQRGTLNNQAGKNRRRFWIAPNDISSRVQLEYLGWAWPEDASPSQFEELLSVPSQIVDPDSDRLASAMLRIQGAQRALQLTPDAVGDHVVQSRNIFQSQARLLPIHQRFEPYFAVAAEELACAGEVESVLALLVSHSELSESLGVTFSETVAADRASAKIIRKFRLFEVGYASGESLERTDNPHDGDLALAIRALSGDPITLPSTANYSDGSAHKIWTAAGALDRASAESLLIWARTIFHNVRPYASFYIDSVFCLDAMEANELAAQFSLEPVSEQFNPRIKLDRLSTVEAFEVALRMWSLDIGPEPDADLVNRIGPRLAATMALELGELLALRLPLHSLRILGFAMQNFHQSGDDMQETMACTCLALASVRAGQKTIVTGMVNRLGVLFAKGQSDLMNPSAWNSIDSFRDGSAFNGHPEWTRPWLMRVALCLTLDRDGGSPGKHSGRLLHLLSAMVRRLSPELSFAVEPVSSPDPAPPLAARAAFDFDLDLPSLVLNIECMDKVTRPQQGTRILLSRGGATAEFKTPSPTAPYNEAAETTAIGKSLAEFQSAKLCVVDRNAAWVSWESILDPTGYRMYSRRTNDKDVPRPDLMNWNSPSFYTLTMHHVGADLAGTAFPMEGSSYSNSDPEQLSTRNVLPGGVQVLHVVSDVIETSGGARLTFRDERQSDRGKVYRAEEFPKMLPDIRLYILQLPVGFDEGRRNGVCREKAALLRSFAAHLQLASHQIVITLPGLRFDEGVLLLKAISNGIVNPTPTPAVAIYGELKNARSTLFKTLPTDEAEAGFDICYFG